MRLRYRGQASQPNMVDLLPISDNTDPLNIQNGNPGLKPTFTNELRAEYNFFNTEKQRGMFSFFRYQNIMNNISDRKVYDSETGGYVTTPENINGNWNLIGMVGTNIALRNKKYTINTFTRANYQNMVSYISEKDLVSDTDKNITKRLSLGERLRGTYRNDWWEFSLNGSLDYTFEKQLSGKQQSGILTSLLMEPAPMCVCRGICPFLQICRRTPAEDMPSRV